LPTRYNEKRLYRSIPAEYLELANKGSVIHICPEQCSGLPTPRMPMEIISGDGFDVLSGKSKVIDKEGNDLTDKLIKGANMVLEIAMLYNVKSVIFKDNSPSCGVTHIYDGSFSGRLIAGCGVTTALLTKYGISVRGV